MVNLQWLRYREEAKASISSGSLLLGEILNIGGYGSNSDRDNDCDLHSTIAEGDAFALSCHGGRTLDEMRGRTKANLITQPGSYDLRSIYPPHFPRLSKLARPPFPCHSV